MSNFIAEIETKTIRSYYQNTQKNRRQCPMDDLLSRALSVAEILIIKRDFDLLIKIATQLPAEIQTQEIH